MITAILFSTVSLEQHEPGWWYLVWNKFNQHELDSWFDCARYLPTLVTRDFSLPSRVFENYEYKRRIVHNNEILLNC